MQTPPAPVAAVRPSRNTAVPGQRMGLSGPPPAPQVQKPGNCRVLTASYGGKTTLLVRATTNGETRLTALSVVDGFETSMFDTYAKVNAPGAELAGTFDSKDEALAAARELCPAG